MNDSILNNPVPTTPAQTKKKDCPVRPYLGEIMNFKGIIYPFLGFCMSA
jgi:hypothetical protein